MKKSYIGYAPKASNVVKLASYIQDGTKLGEKLAKLPKKTIKKKSR